MAQEYKCIICGKEIELELEKPVDGKGDKEFYHHIIEEILHHKCMECRTAEMAGDKIEEILAKTKNVEPL